MADRFTYFPLNGVFIALVWGSVDVMARWRLNQTIVALSAGLVLAACAARTRDQLSYWRNSEALWRHAIAVTSGNTIAYFNLGTLAEESGRLAEAMEYYRMALQYSPSYFDAHYNLGVLLASQNRNDEAIEHFRAALQVKPNDTAARNNVGVALLAAGRAEDAIEQFA